MSLSGLDDWQRISHAAITLVKDKIYLATHCASFQPKAIQIYTIDIKFPTVDKKGSIQRKLVASTCLDKDDFHVTQMVFKRRADNLQLYLGLGGKKKSIMCEKYIEKAKIWALKQYYRRNRTRMEWSCSAMGIKTSRTIIYY